MACDGRLVVGRNEANPKMAEPLEGWQRVLAMLKRINTEKYSPEIWQLMGQVATREENGLGMRIKKAPGKSGVPGGRRTPLHFRERLDAGFALTSSGQIKLSCLYSEADDGLHAERSLRGPQRRDGHAPGADSATWMSPFLPLRLEPSLAQLRQSQRSLTHVRRENIRIDLCGQ